MFILRAKQPMVVLVAAVEPVPVEVEVAAIMEAKVVSTLSQAMAAAVIMLVLTDPMSVMLI